MSIEQDTYILGNSEVAISDTYVPPEFIVKESDDLDKVSCGIAVNQKDLNQRLSIVTDRYLKAGYISNFELNSHGVYNDKYETYSVPIIAKIGDKTAASLRLIPNVPGQGLPINNEGEIEIYPEWKDKISTIPFEISQLAKSLEFYRDPRPTLSLFRSYIAYSRYLNQNEAAAVVDSRVTKFLNSRFMSFGLPQIGDSVNYMGSESIPLYVNIDDVVRSTAEGGHSDLSQFLDTGKAPGFEWYKGM